ncbi:putative DNA helicase [Helianthus annuus]|uniref:DNA helicase n=1 Tax=Helianthus annuus TaxID=4232 RepID=A0A251RTE0_HELAN|nr:putative DNA helicase [Helianthus annuus]
MLLGLSFGQHSAKGTIENWLHQIWRHHIAKWNLAASYCKIGYWFCGWAYLSASRIILAPDGDAPGQALAEELLKGYSTSEITSVKLMHITIKPLVRSISTGWKALEDLYNVVPGELTVVTGVLNSGKSEWIDALLCNLNRSVGWKFALCSLTTLKNIINIII